MNASALEVLQQLDTQEYLFMNQQTDKPYASISSAWDRLREKAGLPHLRLHDLRHQLASFLVNDGRTLYVAADSGPFRPEGHYAVCAFVYEGIAGSCE